MYDVTEASLARLAGALRSGETTSVELVEAYRARMAAYDAGGPCLNAVVHDPTVLEPSTPRAGAAAADARGRPASAAALPAVVSRVRREIAMTMSFPSVAAKGAENDGQFRQQVAGEIADPAIARGEGVTGRGMDVARPDGRAVRLGAPADQADDGAREDVTASGGAEPGVTGRATPYLPRGGGDPPVATHDRTEARGELDRRHTPAAARPRLPILG